jgi:hypothetical protein
MQCNSQLVFFENLLFNKMCLKYKPNTKERINECVQLVLPVGKVGFFTFHTYTGPFRTVGRSVILKRQHFTLSTPTWNRRVIGVERRRVNDINTNDK